MVTGKEGPLANIKLELRVEALNKLLRDGRVLMFQKGSKLLYKLGRPQDAK
jgi:hypothetical protein